MLSYLPFDDSFWMTHIKWLIYDLFRVKVRVAKLTVTKTTFELEHSILCHALFERVFKEVLSFWSSKYSNFGFTGPSAQIKIEII